MSACPLCGGDAETLAELPASITSESKALDGESRLRLCGTCAHVFTEADVDWHAHYTRDYDATLTDGGLDELVVTPEGKTVFRTDYDYAVFRRMAGDALHGAARVLEFGCGRGRILNRLVRDGFKRTWACDLGERYAAFAESLLGKGRMSVGSIPEGPFDVICTFFVLEHDTNPLQSLKALRQRLAPGGTVFIMLPAWKTNLGDLACADHAHHFSIETLDAVLGAAGLERVSVDVATAGTLAVTARAGEVIPLMPRPQLVEANREAAQPLLETLERLQHLPTRVDPARRVFLYGAGFYAALANAFVPKVAGIYDANPRKQGLERLGHTVAAPQDISKHKHAHDCLVVCINAKSAGTVAAQYREAFGQVLTL
ncbi:MAG: class I SAM-dependent methyltransferase [Myxococcaceae bacterium]|nr:class I SAM-dependent methyltransferase [Myxococcaceae bacterium]